MNYYQHHIGDFNNATMHLERVERSIYRDLIELYYDTEKPLTLDLAVLCRRIRARRDDEPQIVEAILLEFFTKTDDGWVHSRCEEELANYRAKAEANRVNGKKGGRPPKTHGKPNGNPQKTQSVIFENPTETQVEPNKTLTNNHEPITNIKANRAVALPSDFLPSESHQAMAAELGVSVPTELAKFRDYHLAKGSTFKSWDAAFRTWLRNAAEFRKPSLKAVDNTVPVWER